MNLFQNRLTLAIATSALAFACASTTFAAGMGAMGKETTVTVGGAPMYPSKNIIENAVNSKDHTTLVAAVKAAGLVDTLSGTGPFTLFAPTNAAFAALPEGTVDTLLKPENKDKLTAILTYHVVPGHLTSKDIEALAAKSGGTAELKTVQGESLQVMKSGGAWVVVDSKGNKAAITTANVLQSNGVIHVVDKVLMP
ncbi:MAG: fasciclin domain-containing protein [Dokdonella sp.]